MEKEEGDGNKNDNNGISLDDALGYQICNTIIASKYMKSFEKIKLKKLCKSLLLATTEHDLIENINERVELIQNKAKEFIYMERNSNTTKYDKIKIVDYSLLEKIVESHISENSTLKNITIEYNNKTSGCKISRSTVHRKLKNRLHFSFKKVVVRNSKVNKKQNTIQMLLFFARIKDANKRNEIIIWIDESSFNDRNNIMKSWQRKDGEKKVIYDNGRIKSISVMAGITCTECVLMHFNKKTNESFHFKQFLKDLIVVLSSDKQSFNDYNDSKYHLVLDNASIHRTDDVINFLKSTRFKASFLPTYSPMLNNVEQLWSKIKSYTRKFIYSDV